MNKKTIIIIHVAIWTLLFLLPLSFINHGNGVSIQQYMMSCVSPLMLMIVFYTNYLWLTPKYFIKGNKKVYWLVNTIMIVSMGIGLHLWMSYMHDMFEDQHDRFPQPKAFVIFFFILRDIFNLAISAAIATTVELAMRWHHSELAFKEAEAARTEAELKNLRNQINPHFLLNTLNNIYALISFDGDKAQKAVHELSIMLRHILYNNQQETINIHNEIIFITNYINLMKIRVTDNIDIQTHIDIPSNCNIKIAPNIFISLIENAFKHGISNTQPSFIHIMISVDNEKIICCIENSNHPKDRNDHSGHGIGLEQVKKRLDISYPQHYKWIMGYKNNNTIYYSKIIIYDSKLCNNR